MTLTTTTNYINHKLSQKASTGFRRVVTGKTDIVTMNSGRERRNAAWKFKKMQFSASFALLLPQAQDEILQAYYACNGPLMLFRFRDVGDWRVDASPFVIPDAAVGTTNPVQLTKRYQFGAAYADRTIQAVSTAFVKDSAGHDVGGTVDTELGLFTPTSAWGSGTYTWDGTFDLWVRFTSDELDVTMQTTSVATTDVELTEQIATRVTTGS